MLLDNCCFVKEKYFIKHSDFVKMLDSGDTDKQSKRTHICIAVSLYEKTFYIPLRNNLGTSVRKYGVIGHSVPSMKRPDAGLDYRYALLIEDSNYIEKHVVQKLPDAQYNRIQKDYEDIVSEFQIYLNGFIKASYKNRVHREPLYRESSLINYESELKQLYILIVKRR